MIERLIIHRFRGIRSGVLEGLSKINVLIGPNNSGKTAIVEMLYLSATSSRQVNLILDDVFLAEGEVAVFSATTSASHDFLHIEPFLRLRMRHGDQSEPALPYRITEEGGLEINLAAQSSYRGPLRQFRLSPRLPEWGTVDRLRFHDHEARAIALFTIEAGQQGIPSALIPQIFSDTEVTGETYRLHYLFDPTWVYSWHRTEPADELAIWATKEDQKHTQVLLCDLHTVMSHFRPSFAQWAKNQPWDWMKQIREHMQAIFPTLELQRIEIDDAPSGQTGETGYIRTKHGRLLIDHFGDGARHAFKVLATLIPLCEVVDDDHPGLFLWEEPELFMHPATLGRLLDRVVLLTQNKPIQVVLTTQSLEVLAWLALALEGETITVNTTRTFALQREDGDLRLQAFQAREIVGWMEFIGDPRMIGQDKMASPLIYFLRSRRDEV